MENINVDTYYSTGTQHYYQSYPPLIGVTWTDAYDNAKDKSYMGRCGYLATVMSLDEDTFPERSVRRQDRLAGRHDHDQWRNPCRRRRLPRMAADFTITLLLTALFRRLVLGLRAGDRHGIL